ncbi:MAG: hypothetical protein D6731_18905 [Planctomycetota bacterium]|nr:MAG: hypothetical protein D6731_18905 [Planctomycetota bacterium]
MDFLIGLAFLGAGLVVWSAQSAANRRALLRRLAPRIEGRFVFVPDPLSDEVRGVHQGRPIRVRLSTRPFRRATEARYPLTVSLELQHAPPLRLRIRRDQGLAAVEKALGLVRDVEVSGGDRFDRQYLVETDGPLAGGPLADEEVRRAVEAILVRWDLEEVRVESGKLIVRGDSRWLGRTMLYELLYELDVLAHAYDRRPAPEVRGLRARFFWVGGAGTRPRCPYCHEEVSDPEALTSCAGCSTLLHPECLAENRGCPILGCGHSHRPAPPLEPLKP